MATSSLTFTFGILGNIISFLVYMAPISTFYQIYQRKSTGDYQPLSYIVALLSSMLWLYYAVLKGIFLLITINSVGCVVEAIYIILYISYAPKDTRISTFKLLSAVTLGFFAMVLFTKYVVLAPHHIQALEWICASVSVGVYAAPLGSVAKVVRSKKVESMSFSLTFTLTLSGIIWFVYGLFLKDMFIAIPCALGIVLGLIQMLLYAIYRNPN